jgi:hypothetical protein
MRATGCRRDAGEIGQGAGLRYAALGADAN